MTLASIRASQFVEPLALPIIADSATHSNLAFYARLFEYFEAIGAYHTVWKEV